MLAAIGWGVGRTGLEHLAWSAVAFGTWDIAYYAWLWVLIGWPPSPDAWDVLFLLPIPWIGPVWAPVIVTLALVGVGLAAARRLRSGRRLALGRWHVLAGLAGGALVVASFIAGAPTDAAARVPGSFAWPLFAAGMALVGGAAAGVLRPWHR